MVSLYMISIDLLICFSSALFLISWLTWLWIGRYTSSNQNYIKYIYNYNKIQKNAGVPMSSAAWVRVCRLRRLELSKVRSQCVHTHSCPPHSLPFFLYRDLMDFFIVSWWYFLYLWGNVWMSG